MSEILQWSMRQVRHPISGVLHIGANSGQEAEAYFRAGLKVAWVEADPGLMTSLQRNIAKFSNQSAYQCLASNVDGQEIDFHVASNGGGSSSVLTPDTDRFAKEWPGIKEVESVRLHTFRLETFFAGNVSAIKGLDLIVADVQGYELPVLSGLGSLIDGFRIVIAELNWAPMYKEATRPYKLEKFLVERGFRRVWLGLSGCQATGVWVRGYAGPIERVRMAISIRLYYILVHTGLISVLRSCGLLEIARKIYYFIKRREK